ncbi:hypothetical protein BRC68_14815 [Halobacteriales archaeon QH_6_64_20]|nr:MAG: hypothetical protein BRC68_14815 [Halobacteriales archaeon QH_6_64_20]
MAGRIERIERIERAASEFTRREDTHKYRRQVGGSMELVVAQVADILVRFVVVFGEIALTGPLSAISLFFGVVIVAFSSGFFGYLVAGAVLDALSDALPGVDRSSPPEAK